MSLVLQEINKQYIATHQGLEQVYQNRLVEGVDYERVQALTTDDAKTNYIKCYFQPLSDIAEANWKKIGETIGKGEEYFLDNNTGYHFGSSVSLCISTDNKLLLCNHSNSIGHTWSGICLWRTELSNLNRGDLRLVLKTNSSNRSNSDVYTSDGWSWKPRNNNWYEINNNKRTMKLSAPNGFALVDCVFSHKDSGEVYLSLSPVKLLSPCPPNLSANGKAYPIGECGMIDSVSGKFYGNSGSGSFSVYNDPVEA